MSHGRTARTGWLAAPTAEQDFAGRPFPALTPAQRLHLDVVRVPLACLNSPARALTDPTRQRGTVACTCTLGRRSS